MKIKTLIIILLTASLTILLFQNSEPIGMKILWMEFQISKLIVIGAVFIVGLIVGLLWASPKKKLEDGEIENSVLEEEDKEWLSEDN